MTSRRSCAASSVLSPFSCRSTSIRASIDERRHADLLTGAFSANEVHTSETPILSSFRFSISRRFLKIVAHSSTSPVCFCTSAMEERHA
jgi:L-aminopeptidase/D-esterase-like protein